MITQGTETLTKRDRDTYSDLGGMAGRLRDTGWPLKSVSRNLTKFWHEKTATELSEIYNNKLK